MRTYGRTNSVARELKDFREDRRVRLSNGHRSGKTMLPSRLSIADQIWRRTRVLFSSIGRISATSGRFEATNADDHRKFTELYKGPASSGNTIGSSTKVVITTSSVLLDAQGEPS